MEFPGYSYSMAKYRVQLLLSINDCADSHEATHTDTAHLNLHDFIFEKLLKAVVPEYTLNNNMSRKQLQVVSALKLAASRQEPNFNYSTG